MKQSLDKMQATLEKNGKPCCLNLITENDSKFLAKIAKEKRIQEELLAEQAREAQLAAELANQAKDPKDKKGDAKAAAAALA